MAKDILDAVYGCLIAGAIGDSMGAPVEGWYYREIKEKYGKVDRFMPFKTGYSDGSPGTITDDTVLKHYLCLTIIRRGGRILPEDFARTWVELVNADRLWVNERLTQIKLKQGMNPWDAGQGNIPAGCASMAIAPVGIINAGNPEQAYQDGMAIASVNQFGSNRDAAASLAAATAAAFVPGASVDSVIDAALKYSSWFMRRAYELTLDLAEGCSSVDEFAERFYDRLLDWSWPQEKWNKEHFFSGNSHEFVPASLAILRLCRGDVNRCIVEGASFGRDCDTIANVVGGIAGALQGAASIKQDWIQTCEKANAEFFEEVEGDAGANFYKTAVRMVEALKNEQRRAGERADQLARILGLSGST
jgi:ADP-ribosylglycohydrolase